jgi:hypothetical protein
MGHMLGSVGHFAQLGRLARLGGLARDRVTGGGLPGVWEALLDHEGNAILDHNGDAIMARVS